LKKDKIAKRHVKWVEKKHQFIMYLLQKTANQQAGSWRHGLCFQIFNNGC
jgi:hypothetical protein